MLQPRTAPVASLAAGIMAIALLVGLTSGTILPDRTTASAAAAPAAAAPDGYVVTALRFGDPAVGDHRDAGLTMGALRFSLAGADYRPAPDDTAVYALVGAYTVACKLTQRAVREVPAHVHCDLDGQAARVTPDAVNSIEVVAYRTHR